MNDLSYIGFDRFKMLLSLDWQLRYKVVLLSEAELYMLYSSGHRVIDTEFEYIGVAINPERAFPRDFKKEIDSPDFPKRKKDFLSKYSNNPQTNWEFGNTAFLIARDMLLNESLEEALLMRERLKVSSISGQGSKIDIDTMLIKPDRYSPATLSFLHKFTVGSVAFQVQ